MANKILSKSGLFSHGLNPLSLPLSLHQVNTVPDGDNDGGGVGGGDGRGCSGWFGWFWLSIAIKTRTCTLIRMPM